MNRHSKNESEKPDGPFLVVRTTVPELERMFGEAFYFPATWDTPVHRGENLNLIRPFYEKHAEYDEVVWWQTHVRGWITADGRVELRGHFEPLYREHPSSFLNGVGYSVERGMRAIVNILDENRVEYEIKHARR